MSARPWNLQLFADEKTEEASPRRREEVRKKGQAARSNDLCAAVIMLGVILVLFWLKDSIVAGLDRMLQRVWLLLADTDLTFAEVINLTREVEIFYLLTMAPIFGVAVAIALGINVAQVGLVFSPEAIAPKLEKINPIEGLKRIFSRRALMELVKSLLKVTTIGLVAYFMVRSRFPQLIQLIFMESGQVLSRVTSLIFRIALVAMILFLVLAVIDYLFQRQEFLRRIRMTKQEVKEELKQAEGDPQLRARIRERQRELSRRRMMQEVPKATVVITNPTHLAVALRYLPPEDQAPVIVAKGADLIAKRIRDLANQHGVPLVEQPDLARLLYRTVEIGRPVPETLYRAVAEILALVFRNQRRTL